MSQITSEAAARSLFETVPKVNRALRALVFSSTKASLSMPQYRVLSFLSDTGPSTMAALADHEGVRAPTMSRFIDSLETKTFVQREKSATDKRSTVVTLTSRGSSIVKEVRQKVVKELDGMMSAWPSQDLALVVTTMGVLKGHNLTRRHS